jgi:hypothetical protein
MHFPCSTLTANGQRYLVLVEERLGPTKMAERYLSVSFLGTAQPACRGSYSQDIEWLAAYA